MNKFLQNLWFNLFQCTPWPRTVKVIPKYLEVNGYIMRLKISLKMYWNDSNSESFKFKNKFIGTNDADGSEML